MLQIAKSAFRLRYLDVGMHMNRPYQGNEVVQTFSKVQVVKDGTGNYSPKGYKNKPMHLHHVHCKCVHVWSKCPMILHIYADMVEGKEIYSVTSLMFLES